MGQSLGFYKFALPNEAKVKRMCNIYCTSYTVSSRALRMVRPVGSTVLLAAFAFAWLMLRMPAIGQELPTPRPTPMPPLAPIPMPLPAPIPMPLSAPIPMPLPAPPLQSPAPIYMPAPDSWPRVDKKSSLESLRVALKAANARGSGSAIIRSLIALGGYYSDSGKKEKAITYFSQALAIQRSLGDPKAEASIMQVLGVIYSDLGQKQKALEILSQAFSIEDDGGELSNEAETLNRIGMVYYTLGEQQNALSKFHLAFAIGEGLTDRRVIATTLTGIGLVEYSTGDVQKAQEDLDRALAIQIKLRDRRGEAATLTGIGLVLTSLSQQRKALTYFKQALSIEDAIGDHRSQAAAMNNIGWVYDALDQKRTALNYLQQALSMQRETDDLISEAYTLDSIGLVYHHLGDDKRALETYNKALPIEREAGERDCQSNSLWGRGEIARAEGDFASAVRDEAAALSLAQSIGDPNLQGRIDTSLMRLFRHQERLDAAIFFGIDAVNSYQQIRKNMNGLDRGLQAGFAQSKSPTYRELAELLVTDNRLVEAEHVLDMLKDAEFEETVRGAADDPASKADPLPLSDVHRIAEVSIDAEAKNAASLTEDGFEADRLNALSAPTDAEKARLKTLNEMITADNTEIQNFFNKTLYEELGGNTESNARISNVDTETSSLANLLPDLGPGTLALYTIVGDQHCYIIVITATIRTHYELHTNAADLGKLVLALRQELRTPASDPSKDLATLSHILLDPITADLAAAAKQSPDGVPTLLWSLDGVLRYVPMNALFDPTQMQGRRYLAESARNVVITPVSRNHLLDMPANDTLRAVAFGVSQSYLDMPALSGVPAELDAVVHDPAVTASHGPLYGQLLHDDAFTLTALESSLKQNYSVVHIASHFVFQAGKPGESYLLLGGKEAGDKGYKLTMSTLQGDPRLSFRGIRLLTLSACSTAESDTNENGREIDSLGMVMQKRDAAAVLATLWEVNDVSTSLLMSDFYRRWATMPGVQKIEALRQAQIAMLHGTTSPLSVTDRGFRVTTSPATNSSENYAHPYFWAPFILIGNFR